jgi:antitoxin MazE
MRVAKWGNSLAVRLPTAVVEGLALQEGDQIEISVLDKRRFGVARDKRSQKAIETIRSLRRPLPAGFRFSRQEANER